MRIEIDRSRPLHLGAERGHNRWHPGLTPVATVEPGDDVTFEIRDSRDRLIGRHSDHDDLLAIPAVAHPLTGPLEVRSALPGDVLELDVLGYETDDFGWTAIWPGSGFLGDLFDRPFLARWELAGGLARSDQIPGVAVPACVHAGTIGVAPSPELFERAREREAAIGTPNPPSREHAWPPEAAPPRPPRAMFASTGIPLADDGRQGDLDINLATRCALVELLAWLEHERGLQRAPAYVLMSVAAELRVSELVDAPNPLVSAALPLDVFEQSA